MAGHGESAILLRLVDRLWRSRRAAVAARSLRRQRMPLPGRVARPPSPEVDHSAGLGGRAEQIERCLDDRVLILDVAELTGGVAQLVVDERGARWSHREGDVARR